MNRKQGIIIVVLLALIATAGVLASRLNSPLLNVSGSGGSDAKNPVVSSYDPNGNVIDESSLKTDSFAQAKADRSQQYNDTIQSLKAVMQDKNVSADTKQQAEATYLDITMNNNYESKVELALKAKGYQDVVCIIENDKVNVTIKSADPLDETAAREIKNDIVRITNLVDIVISVQP